MKGNTGKCHLSLSLGESDQIKFGNTKTCNHINISYVIRCKTKTLFCKNSKLI